VPRKFDRNARLMGVEAVERLAHAHVAVFGLGGVGSYAAEGLARAGVGRLTLVDFDDVCITNINRQLHAFPHTVGQPKADLMTERVRAINPAVDVRGIKAFYAEDTSAQLLEPAPDYVLDCIDNITAKMHLVATCLERGIPIVTCLGASAKVDPARVKVATLADTHTDRLARAVRRYIQKRHAVDESRLEDVIAVFSDEDPIWPDPGYQSALCGVNCVCPGKGNSRHSCDKRNVIHGSAVFVTSVFGMVGASVVVRRLTTRFPVPLESYIIRERRLKKAARRKPGREEP
jgi:tRNA A37 threonylcarbamoyladenosine dehydratase